MASDVPCRSVLTTATELQGRHPCIVNDIGEVLNCAGEGKDKLAETAPPKKRTAKSCAGGKPSSKKQPAVHQDVHSESEALSGKDSTEESVHSPSPQFVYAGLPSSSGNPRKRTQLETPAIKSMSGEQARAARPMKAVPARNTQEPCKRKCSITEGPMDFKQLIGFPPQHWQSGGKRPYMGPARADSAIPMQHGGPTAAPLYPQQFNPLPPFAPPAGYLPQSAFPTQGYLLGFYQPPYGHPRILLH